MKKIFKYIFAGMAAMSVVACSEDALETSPSSSVSGNELLGTATNALVSLNGVYRAMYTAGVSNSSNTHQCFGITAYNLVADVMGEDCIMNGQGSGWFWYDCVYNVKSRYTSTGWRSYDMWNGYYTWISNVNYILAEEETMSGSETEKNYVLGQAYAVRAYSYFMLAQMFSRTYKGHESEPCVHSIQNRLILQQKVKGAQRLKKYINKSLRILTKQLPCWATQVKENISAISMRLLPQV